MLFGLQKGLEGASQGRMFPLPFDSWAAGKLLSGEMNQGRKQPFLGQDFFRIFGIDVDGGIAKVLAGNLSPMGRLFEIYFVRLIGTPNQNYKKMPAPVGIKLVVQTNH
jgi:hypothetical protein